MKYYEVTYRNTIGVAVKDGADAFAVINDAIKEDAVYGNCDIDYEEISKENYHDWWVCEDKEGEE